MANFGTTKTLMGLRRRFGSDIKISNKNNNKKQLASGGRSTPVHRTPHTIFSSFLLLPTSTKPVSLLFTFPLQTSEVTTSTFDNVNILEITEEEFKNILDSLCVSIGFVRSIGQLDTKIGLA